MPSLDARTHHENEAIYGWLTSVSILLPAIRAVGPEERERDLIDEYLEN